MSNVGRRRVLLAGTGVAASLLAGCSGGGGDDPADRGPIAIEELAFAAERPTGRDEYERQPDATYTRGELVWLYADYVGLSGDPIEEESDEGMGDDESDDSADGEDGDEAEDTATVVGIDLHQTLTVEGPDGEQIVESEATFREELTVPQLERYFTGTEILLSGDVTAGEYRTTVTVTDLVSETEATETATFRIES